MEDSNLEPLASEITIRRGSKPAKGLWSSRSAGSGPSAAAPTSSEIWSHGLKQSGTSKLVYSLLAEFRTANEEGRYVQAVGAYREAANLSRIEKSLKEAALDHGLKEIKALTANNWRVAAALLREVSELDPSRVVAPNIGLDIERSEREETVANALAEVKPGGDGEQAYSRLTRALLRYPGDPVLEGHLADVSATLVEKRGATERRKRLAIMASLLAELERSTDAADGLRFVRLSESALGPYRSDADMFAIYGEIQKQATVCQDAAFALASGQVSRCLQVCSRTLHETPHQQIILRLRSAARAFVYSDQGAACAEVRELFEKGPLAEAQEVCKQAIVQFPGSSELSLLETGIREKDAAIHSLVEAGEASLLRRDVETAGFALLEAQSLLPLDPELGAHMATLLHGHARNEIDQDWRAFDASLDLLNRLQPDLPLPADIAAVVQRRKQHAETIRLQAEAIHKIAERGLQADVLRDATSTEPKPRAQGKLKASKTSRESANEQATAESGSWIGEIPIVRAGAIQIGRTPSAKWFDKTTIGVLAGVAATLLFATLLAWHDHQTRATRKSAPVVAVVEPARLPDGSPATKDIGEAAASSASAATQMATLEIRGAEPGTEVKVDKVLVGAAVPGSSLTRELSSGDHVVELSREGFVSSRMALHFAPGEVALLTGSNVQLQSTDASALSAERRDWSRASQASRIADVQDFMRKYPASVYGAQAKARVRDLQWKSVDKTDTAALLAFGAKYPDHPLGSQARDLAQSLNRQTTARTEQSDWLNLNKGNKSSLTAFLAKYPNGVHVGPANTLLSDLDRQEAAQVIAARPREGEDSHRLESATTVARVDIPLREEHKLPVISPIAADPTLAESAAVLDVIGRFATAWNAKDYRSLVAIEPDLNRRSLKAQLSPVKAVMMRISPVAPPQITGTQATVVCRRQADETFTDGSLKQNPESIVTYVLSKRNGSWGIEAIR